MNTCLSFPLSSPTVADATVLSYTLPKFCPGLVRVISAAIHFLIIFTAEYT